MNPTLKLLSVLLLLVIKNVSSDSLCSVRKSETSCVCKRVTNANASSVVTEADCARTSLKTIPRQDQFAGDLNFLDLSHNEIEQVDGSNKFSSKTLETLVLSYNRIKVIGDGFFDEIPNLKKLDLSHNSIASLDSEVLFEKCQELLYLDLSFNNIKSFHTFMLAPLTNLRELDLSYNDPTLGEILTQTSNFLIENLKMNPNILSLKLDNLGLKDLHNLYFANLTNLKHLSLADNHFEEFPSIPYSVEYLDLSASDIALLQANHLSYHSLKVLKLERMKYLESIHHYAFYNLQALEELSIRHCPKLEEFNSLVFGVLHKKVDFLLKKVSLSGNSLKSLNSTYQYLFAKADYVDLSDNPWDCGCDLLWLQDVKNLVKTENIRCSSPSLLHGRKFVDLTENSVPSCYSQKYGKKSHRVVIAMLSCLVILLAALVGYLVYYYPTWYSTRSRSVGPNSPYNPTRLNDE